MRSRNLCPPGPVVGPAGDSPALLGAGIPLFGGGSASSSSTEVREQNVKHLCCRELLNPGLMLGDILTLDEALDPF